jgi:chaperone required for assembly of F1-ATPase
MASSDADRMTRPRRFYREAALGPAAGGHGVLLDGKLARTAGGAALAAPTPELAAVLASEWQAQAEVIDFAAMPATRLAFTVIDRGGGAVHADLAKEAARYAGSDTLCYPVERPRALAERQSALWAPWRDWARDTLGLRFETAGAALHHAQPPETLARVEAIAAALDPFSLAGVVFACGLYGSAILALAVQRRALDAGAAFDLSRLEEAFQAEQWGLDAEAEARAEAQRAEAAMLERWFAALA